MAPRPMKWHIINRFSGACAVTEDDKAIEFDTQDDALEYLESVDNPEFVEEAEIREGILYYDGGYADYSEARKYAGKD